MRFYLTNTANTRVFKVELPGARMKLVGGDSGRCEREEFIEDVVLAPSERAVVDVLFDDAGQLALEHHTPDRTYPLGGDHGDDRSPRRRRCGGRSRCCAATPSSATSAAALPPPGAEPDKTLAFVAEMDFDGAGDGPRGLRVPDAPGGDREGARPLPGVRHEADRRRSATSARSADVPATEPRRCPIAA